MIDINKVTDVKEMNEKSKRLVFHGTIFDTYQWEQKMFDGTTRTFEKVKRPNTVVCICITVDKKFIVTKQEQPGKSEYLSLLGGRVDEGETPLEAVQREVLEESGYTSNEIELYTQIVLSKKIDWTIFVYIAKNCIKVSEQNLDSGGERIELMFLDFDQFLEFILDESFEDQKLQNIVLRAKLNPKKMEELKNKLLN